MKLILFKTQKNETKFNIKKSLKKTISNLMPKKLYIINVELFLSLCYVIFILISKTYFYTIVNLSIELKKSL